MEFAGRQLVRPSWLACRSYGETEAFPEWSVIYNLREGRLLLLEGSSSAVWRCLRFGQPLEASAPAAASILQSSEK